MSKKNGLEASSSKNGATESTPLVAKNGIRPHESRSQGGDGGGGGGGGGDDGHLSGGLSVSQTTLLIAGEMAGSGVLALPKALAKTGWVGVPVIILMCCVAAFSGKRLGDCWTILEARDPTMRSRKRNPYSIIAHQALGKTWSVIVSMAILVTLFGASVVYLLMAAQIVEEVLMSLVPTVTYCTWYLLVAGAMTPLMMFGSPKDFPYSGLVALVSTVVACVLYFIQMLIDIKPFPIFRYGIHDFQSFFLAFGTIMFAFGGASTFPTIQNDMKDKSKFSKCLLYSFSGILILYLPLSIAGYAIYGESVSANFALSLSPSPITLAGNIFMAIHLVSAFMIIINPVCQEVEELYDVPADSIKWRIAIRLSIMMGILFIGETIPRFNTLLALVGSSTIALLTFVLPSYCYLKIVDQPLREGQPPLNEPAWIRMVCWEVMLLGMVGGVSAFISALNAIFNTAMVSPCYVK